MTPINTRNSTPIDLQIRLSNELTEELSQTSGRLSRISTSGTPEELRSATLSASNLLTRAMRFVNETQQQRYPTSFSPSNAQTWEGRYTQSIIATLLEANRLERALHDCENPAEDPFGIFEGTGRSRTPINRGEFGSINYPSVPPPTSQGMTRRSPGN